MWLNIAGGRRGARPGGMCVRRPSVPASGDEDECEKLEPSAMRFIPLARSLVVIRLDDRGRDTASPPQSSFTSDESVLLPRGTRFDLTLHGDKGSPYHQRGGQSGKSLHRDEREPKRDAALPAIFIYV